MADANMSSPNNTPQETKGSWCTACKQFMLFEEGWKHMMMTIHDAKDGQGHKVNFFDTRSSSSIEMARLEGVPLEKFAVWAVVRKAEMRSEVK